MIIKKYCFIADTTILLVGCDIDHSLEARGNPENRSLEDKILVGDNEEDLEQDDIVMYKQFAYAKDENSRFNVYGVGTNDRLDLAKCYEKGAVCISTELPYFYKYQKTAVITGSNECVDEWGVQLEVNVSYAKTSKDIGDLWRGYPYKSLLHAIIANHEGGMQGKNGSITDYRNSQYYKDIPSLSESDIQRSVIGDDIEQLNAYIDAINDAGLSDLVGEALRDSYRMPHGQYLSNLTTKINNDIQTKFPKIVDSNVVLKGFKVGGRVDDQLIVENENIIESFSCQT